MEGRQTACALKYVHQHFASWSTVSRAANRSNSLRTEEWMSDDSNHLTPTHVTSNDERSIAAVTAVTAGSSRTTQNTTTNNSSSREKKEDGRKMHRHYLSHPQHPTSQATASAPPFPRVLCVDGKKDGKTSLCRRQTAFRLIDRTDRRCEGRAQCFMQCYEMYDIPTC